jgi:hypothetical protein
MSLAPDRDAIVKTIMFLQQLKVANPNRFPFLAIHESLHVPNHDEAISSTRYQNIQPLGCSHETDVTLCIASCEGHNYNVTFLALIIVCLWY